MLGGEYLRHYYLLVDESVNGFEIWYNHKNRRKTEWGNYYIRNPTLSSRRAWQLSHNGDRFADSESKVSLKNEHPKVYKWVIKKITKFQSTFVDE